MRTKLFFCMLLSAVQCIFPFERLMASDGNDTIPSTTCNILISGDATKPMLLAPYYKNVIKFNPTPMWMWEQPQNLTFSYEKLLKNNNSIAFMLGYLVFPQVLKDTLINTFKITDYSTKGINVAVDFRHYLGARNTRPAPDGLYIGGYCSFNGTAFENKFTTLDSQVGEPGSLNGKASMTNLGCEIGYQFIFWKRFSVDLLMCGPAVTLYSRKIELTGMDNQEFLDQIDEELASKLVERFPALGFLYKGEPYQASGSNMVLSTSFRYSVQLGYHF
jgi:hypothetical protein